VRRVAAVKVMFGAFALSFGAAMPLISSASGPGGGGGGQPDLTVKIAANPAEVQPGAPLVWMVSVTNSGSGAAGGFDVLVPGTDGVGANGIGWTCASAPTTRSGPARTSCHSAGLLAGASSAIAIPKTAAGTAATYTISATADAGNVVAESNETNNTGTGSYVVPINGPYDFVARHTVSGGADPMLPLETVTFTTSVDNVGLYPGFTTVTVSDALPVGFTFVSWTATVVSWVAAVGPVYTSPGSVSCAPAGDPATGVIVTCTGVPNSSGASTAGGSVSIVAQPPAADGLVDYVATDSVAVDADNAINESDETNNTASGTRWVSNMLPDLAVQMSTPPSPIDAGGVINHEITISNTGTREAVFAQLRFTSLAGSWIGGGGSGGVTCGVIFRTRSGATMGCGVANLPAGASVTFPLQLTAPGTVGTTTTSGNVYVVGAREVPPAADNVASTTATVATAGAVDLTAAVLTAPIVAVGQPTSFAISVTNNGIGVAAATTVDNVLPDGFTFTSGATNVGPCTATGQVVSCPIDATAPGRTQILSIFATAPRVAGPYNDNVVVDPSNVVAESDEANNSANAAVTVSAAFADLTTSIAGPATIASNGKPVYAVTITNSGNIAADTSSFTVYVRGFDRIDSTVVPAGWTCTTTRTKGIGNYVSCTGGPLGVGGSATVQIVAAGAYGRGAWPVTSTVDPTNAVQELSEVNNTATLSTTVS
jgi:uncharacterized repeat protein (TIGR01451 family)